ncbi:MAG TPA: hypothetical protein VHW73_10565 [Rudaea sp.]|nr:hypothetical protein [Rudaea sp.]
MRLIGDISTSVAALQKITADRSPRVDRRCCFSKNYLRRPPLLAAFFVAFLTARLALAAFLAAFFATFPAAFLTVFFAAPVLRATFFTAFLADFFTAAFVAPTFFAADFFAAAFLAGVVAFFAAVEAEVTRLATAFFTADARLATA